MIIDRNDPLCEEIHLKLVTKVRNRLDRFLHNHRDMINPLRYLGRQFFNNLVKRVDSYWK